MRLIDTTTLELQEFNFDELNIKIPFGYAILSHRWRDDEVDFTDLSKKRKTSGRGCEKIVRCCQFARSRGFSWVWIDTCCIDKRSSSELSEAINSMFRWYSRARECYAFLDDVTLGRNDSGPYQVLQRSGWFSRGWTLQELIAPKAVIFLSADWAIIGRKSWKAVEDARKSMRGRPPYSVRGNWRKDAWRPVTMLAALIQITNIPRGVLLAHRHHLQWQSIAEKMSWMAGRHTSRIEDEAYCMLGLFNANMPLLYGEGLKAFDRLQATLLQSSSDESIFAWEMNRRDSWRLLAQRPSQFARSANIMPAMKFQRSPSFMTNQGLRFEILRGLGSQERTGADGRRALEVKLNCTTPDPVHEHLCSMYLEQAACGHFVRKRQDAGPALDPSSTDSSEDAIERSVSHAPVQGCSAKRSFQSTRSDNEEEVVSAGAVIPAEAREVLHIHMGQEHHTTCRLSSDISRLETQASVGSVPPTESGREHKRRRYDSNSDN